ncbi:sulfatase-like hydrolase/transferase [Draconibacterium orientale]|uniref:sulfatase-like hydrolase/transferase n=1 Tax=Draconibacterium orientale TaxID=1168034 RepID=UPI002ABDFCDE|nr:sulfatase-like hydrolase/transferase [Draconibacterium orientale]
MQTPNIDRLANGGVMFTDGHASSATCTPSRYALLTGVYPWRNKDAKILPGTAPLIIDTAQITIPKMLKVEGYYTGVVGKWHLGLGNGLVDWNENVSPGPNEVGFDYSYIMAATQDRVPTVYLENGLVEGLDPNDPIEIDYENNFEGEPTGKDNPELLTMKWHHGHNNSIVNGIPRIGFMKGGDKAKWSDVDMADHFLGKAQNYVKKHKDKPFFLYYALQQPHVPRTPNPRFVGSSNLGPRGDVIVEADWCIGEFMRTLEEEGILENTLIIFSSDNGPVLNDGYYDDAVERIGNHDQNGGLRGGKYSLFEAGTRVPFITYWKGKIEPKKSNALICQLDILASLAELTGADVKDTDSKELLSVLLGKSDKGRDELVLEASSCTALRKDNWLMIPPYKGPAIASQVNIELGNSEEFQLYDLSSDLEQQQNLAKTNPNQLDVMIGRYKSVVGEFKSEVEALELK